MSAKNFIKKQQVVQHGGELKSDYYRSADQTSDHPLSKINYCIDFIEKTCQKGINCKKRHILYQQLRRELKCIQPPYKKHLCQIYESNQKCPKSKYLCLFAHGEDDIWNQRYQEKKAERINATDMDERLKYSTKQTAPSQQQQPQKNYINNSEDLIQKIVKAKKDKAYENKNKNLVQDQIKREDKQNKERKEKKDKVEFKQPQSHQIRSDNPNENVRQNLRVRNKQRIQDVSQSIVQSRNNQRTNNKPMVGNHQVAKNKPVPKNPDAMNDEEFEHYLLSLKEEKLMNEQGVDRDLENLQDDDDEDDEDISDFDDDEDEQEDDDDEEVDDDDDENEDGQSNSSSDGKNDLFIQERPKNSQGKNSKPSVPNNKGPKQSEELKKSNKNEDESWESEENEDEDEEYDDIKEKKDVIKSSNKSQTNQAKNNVSKEQNYNDFKSIDWNKIDPSKMTNEQLMSLNAGIMQQYDNNSLDDDEEEEEENLTNSSKEYNQLDEQKLDEERNKRKQEKVEQRKRRKEEKKQQKLQEKQESKQPIQKQQKINPAQVAFMPQNASASKEQLFQFDQLEIFCFCYFNTEKDLKNWKESILEVFFDLQIPRNAIIITEEDKCEGEHGILIKLKSLRVVCLQLLRINLFKNTKLKILFKALPNPDSQITFSKQIIALNKVNEYSFIGQDGQTYILFNSTIDHSESENLEFKNYDFRNFNENTRKLEEVITGMLNREEFEDSEFYEKEELSGRIFLGVKDSTRQFVGSCTTNNYHESFFTFLAKRLRDCQPSIKANLFSREEVRLVIPGENENEFFPILDMKIFIINIKKPEKNTIYATSSGLFYQKIEEGNWPMSACSLYEKKEKKYISEEKFRDALKQLDRRYFFVMAKMANQNALIQPDIYNVEQSQY